MGTNLSDKDLDDVRRQYEWRWREVAACLAWITVRNGGQTNTPELFEVKLLAIKMLSENRRRGFCSGAADLGGLRDF